MKDKAGHVQLLPSAQVQLKGNDSGRAANQPRAFADKKKILAGTVATHGGGQCCFLYT